MRLIKAFFLFTLLVLGFGLLLPACAKATTGASFVRSCSGVVNSTIAPSLNPTISCVGGPNPGDVFVVWAYTNASPANWTTPTGTWTEATTVGGVTCSPQSKTGSSIHVYYHTITVADNLTNSFAWAHDAGTAGRVTMAEFTHVNTSAPIDACSIGTFAGGATSITPAATTQATAVNDLPVMNISNLNSQQVIAGAATGGGLSSAACALNATNSTQSIQSCPLATGTTGVSITASYTTGPSAGGLYGQYLLAPDTNNYTFSFSTGVSGPFVSTPLAIATPSLYPASADPTVALAEYVGSSSGGASGNDNGGAKTIPDANMQTLFKYLEEHGTSTWNGTCGTSAATGGCYDMTYVDAYDITCQSGAGQAYGQNAINYLDPTAKEGGWLHKTSSTAANRLVITTGGFGTPSCNSPTTLSARGDAAGTKYTVYGNFGSSVFQAAWDQTGFFTSVLPSGAVARWDNFTQGLPQDTAHNGTIEYPAGNLAELATWRAAQASFINHYATYNHVINFFGCGNCVYPSNNATAISTEQIHNYQLEINGFCDNLTQRNVLMITFERLIIGSGNSITNFGPANLWVAINTASDFYNRSTCNGIELSDIGMQPYGVGSADYRPARNMLLAERIFLEDPGFDGTKADRQFVPWRYQDNGCSLICNAYFPEDDAVFVPSPNQPIHTWNSTGATNGKGCGGGSGGIVDYVVQSTCSAGHVDYQGTTVGLISRDGECYKHGVNIGHCTAIYNPSTTDWAIPDAACRAEAGFTGCNSYGWYWKYNGSGPSSWYKDDTGTFQPCGGASATCNGSWGEQSFTPGTYVLGHCENPNTQWGSTSDTGATEPNTCSVLLMSQ